MAVIYRVLAFDRAAAANRCHCKYYPVVSLIYNTSCTPQLTQAVRHALPPLFTTLPHLITAMSATAVLCAPPFLDATNPMSDYSYWQVQNWMLAMSNYPPPPPPEQTHYNALYPTSAGAQQLLDSVQQEQLQFASLNTPAYPKIESGSPSQSSSTQIQGLAHDLSTNVGISDQQRALEDQQRQQINQASQHLQQQAAAQSAAGLNAAQLAQQQADAQKSNRLRKACDSCSIRKVKVCHVNCRVSTPRD